MSELLTGFVMFIVGLIVGAILASMFKIQRNPEFVGNRHPRERYNQNYQERQPQQSTNQQQTQLKKQPRQQFKIEIPDNLERQIFRS